MTARTPFWTAVYRCYDAAGQLLYVGQGLDPHERLKQHRRTGQPWVADVARTDVVWYPDRLDALLAERAATRTEGPLWPSDVESASAYALAVAAVAADLRHLDVGHATAARVAKQLVDAIGYREGADTPSSSPITDEDMNAMWMERIRDGLERVAQVLLDPEPAREKPAA